VSLEELFDCDDVTKTLTMVPTEKCVEDINSGIDDKPKMVKLSKYLYPEVKSK